LSNVGDVEDMGKNALKILENEATLKQFKSNALAKALTFHIDKILPMYEDVYKSLVGEFTKCATDA
jgi:glycosyltransferase involved in cell wall biosynthesis